MKYKIFFKLHEPGTYSAPEERTIVDAETEQAAREDLYKRFEIKPTQWLEIVEVLPLDNGGRIEKG